MRAHLLYQGAPGSEYFKARAGARSTESQRSRARLFEGLTTEFDTVLDFGCGTGEVLRALPARRRVGIDVSEFALAEASRNLDCATDDVTQISDSEIDCVISCHAFEHIESPAVALSECYRILRSGGLLKIVVPCDMPLLTKGLRTWGPNWAMHLYSWTPRTLGNLISVSGFDVVNGCIVPDSQGGRLGAIFPEASYWRRVFSAGKALRTGRFHTCVTARKPA